MLKTADDVVTGELTRCVRPSHRLGLMAPGRPCLLWRSGRDSPGVHALGVLTGPVREEGGGPVVPVRFTPLADPVPRVPASVEAHRRTVRRRPRPDRRRPPGTMKG